MISVIEVYNAVRDLANKDQKGFVSPEMFNSLLPAVQSKIFGKIYDAALQGKALRRSGADLGGEDSLYLKAKNFISEYISSGILQQVNIPSIYDDSGVYKKPENLNRIISVFNDDSVNVDLIYNSEKISRILNSNLSAPTDDFPVGLVSSEIEIFPRPGSDVYINYYRNPTSRYETAGARFAAGEIDYRRQPSYSAQTSGSLVIPNPFDCRAFDLPAEFRDEVVKEICMMIGVSLRDNVLMSYGASQQ
jgi:hypothetical protein